MMQETPKYHPEDVQPLRDELVSAGFKELLSPQDVETAVNDSGDDTVLFVVNSVCGCAAGTARPGVTLALQNATIPDRLFTAFAGMEKSAVSKLREYLEPNLPSSPAIALFKSGKLLHIMHRYDIEGHSAVEVAENLVSVFNDKCSALGPSIPREAFEKLVSPDVCGSTLALYGE